MSRAATDRRITLRPISAANYEAALALKVTPEQDAWVAPVVQSLADAFVHEGAQPRLVYADDEPVGFVLVYPWTEGDLRVVSIVRLLIDQRFQRRGFGRAALLETLRWAASLEPRVARYQLTTKTDNRVALHLYESLGFVRNAAVDEYGEAVLTMPVEPPVSPLSAAGPYEASELPQPPWRTERLLLRPFTMDDASLVHEALDRDEDVWIFDPGHPPTLEERRSNILRYETLRRQFGFGPCGAWLAEPDGSEGVLVGQGGLNPYVYDHLDGRRTAEFEVMYKLARPFWGAGYATEIARFWARFAFEHVRLPRLLVCPVKANTRSVAVLERLGATLTDDWLDPDTTIACLKRNEFVGDA